MELINNIKIRLKNLIDNKDDKSSIKPIKIVRDETEYYLILKNNLTSSLLTARSLDGIDFDLTEKLHRLDNFVEDFSCSAVVSDLDKRKKKIMYFGDRFLHLATFSKNHGWTSNKKSLLNSHYPVELGGAFLFSRGIIILYFEKLIDRGITYYQAQIAEFDKKKPDKLLWKTDKPIWSSKDHWPDKKVVALGSIMNLDKIVTYWYIDNEIIYAVYLSGFNYSPDFIAKKQIKLSKHKHNPILKPKPDNNWEAFTTLNPAAVYLRKKVHILYRAQGYDYISSVGYAVSNDGLKIDQRFKDPIYRPNYKFETNLTGDVNPQLMSAGGYGGCEDPRITLLGNKLYMVYVAFDGWSNLRLALTSIHIDDFLNQRWNWAKPVLISPPHVIDKSGCLLPEKINGKYVFFHRIFPNILIDFVDDLNFNKKDKWLKGEYKIKVRPGMWDSRKIGAGAPPIKTDDGWLLIYYGVDDQDAGKYHIGAMLLDLTNPTRVIRRTNSPILSPSEEYENNGFKPGIAYPCGAVIVNDQLLVYYGAADSTVCVASANLPEFLKQLRLDESPRLTPIIIKEVNY